MAAGSPTLTFRVSEIEKDVKDHSEFINGNGKEGAKTRIKTLEDAVARIETRIDKLVTAAWGLAATILATGIGWLLFKVLPDLVAGSGS